MENRVIYHVQFENLSFPLAQTTGLDVVKVYVPDIADVTRKLSLALGFTQTGNRFMRQQHIYPCFTLKPDTIDCMPL
jgi:hypothetical protein